MELKKQKNKTIIVIVDHQYKNHINYLKKNKNKFVDNVFFFDNRLNSILKFHMISKYNILKKIYYYRFFPKLTAGLIIISILRVLDAEFKMIGFSLKKKNSSVDYYYQSTENKKKGGTSHDFERENNILINYFNKYM